MIAYLNRFGSTPMGTFGELIYGDFHCYTIEREWHNNQKNVSCIPSGQYNLVRHESPKFGNVYALIGQGISIHPEGHNRWGILIHPANVQKELQGCIALGSALGSIHNEWAVTSSRRAVNKFYALLENDSEPSLIIEWSNP